MSLRNRDFEVGVINRTDKSNVAVTKCTWECIELKVTNTLQQDVLHLNLKLNLSAGTGCKPTSDKRDLLDNSRVRLYWRKSCIVCHQEERIALLTWQLNSVQK